MQQKTYQHSEHHVSRHAIDPDAIAIIQRLQQAGFTAYLVGGGVRDLLLGLHPKDFDISTSAHPQQIKALFPHNCILIGRRFRLAHLRYGKKILEVATFRAGDPSTSSLIVRDNTWGTEEEDVLRRDFTINALFYDPSTEEIIDYVNGFQDIQHHLLKTIGNPTARFKQDPVRMIRLLKFQARFAFHYEKPTLSALHHCREEILKSSPARLLEEMMKMLESGKAAPFFQLLTEHQFLEYLFPCFQYFFARPEKETPFVYLKALDSMHTKTLHRPTRLAALIFPILEQELKILQKDRQHPVSLRLITQLAKTLTQGINTSSFVHFPKKLISSALYAIIEQFRIAPQGKIPKRHLRFHSKEESTYAIELLQLRTIITPQLAPVLSYWQEKLFNA